jgi:hypothetical protein
MLGGLAAVILAALAVVPDVSAQERHEGNFIVKYKQGKLTTAAQRVGIHAAMGTRSLNSYRLFARGYAVQISPRRDTKDGI